MLEGLNPPTAEMVPVLVTIVPKNVELPNMNFGVN